MWSILAMCVIYLFNYHFKLIIMDESLQDEVEEEEKKK